MTTRRKQPEPHTKRRDLLALFLLLFSLSPGICAQGDSLSKLHEEAATEPAVKRWLCDMDGDGRAELISFRQGVVFGFFDVAYRNGSSFESFWQSEELGFFHDAAAGDVDKDGVDELVAVGYSRRSNGNVMLILDFHDGAFWVSEYPIDYRTELISVGDINNDGENEIVTVRIDYRSEDDSSETILTSQINAEGIIEIGASIGHTMIADLHVDDFDGDGQIELLVAESKGEPTGAHETMNYTPFLNVYRWGSEGLSAEPVISREGHVGMPYPKISFHSTGESRRILLADSRTLWECRIENDTISDPVELLTPPEGIVSVSSGDIDGTGDDSLVMETWTFDPSSDTKVRGVPGRGALRIYKIGESQQD